MPNFGDYLLSFQNPTLGSRKKDYEGCGFCIKTSKQFLHCAHSNMQKQKGRPVPTSRYLREGSLPLLLREYKPKVALLRLLFKTPVTLTRECTKLQP